MGGTAQANIRKRASYCRAHIHISERGNVHRKVFAMAGHRITSAIADERISCWVGCCQVHVEEDYCVLKNATACKTARITDHPYLHLRFSIQPGTSGLEHHRD